MNKSELINNIAKSSGISKDSAGRALGAFLKSVSTALRKGEQVTLVGFGSFQVRNRAARKGRNPQTGQTIQIKASKVPVFRAGKALKSAVH